MEVEGMGGNEGDPEAMPWGREVGHGLRKLNGRSRGQRCGSRRGEEEPNAMAGAGSCCVGGFLTA